MKALFAGLQRAVRAEIGVLFGAIFLLALAFTSFWFRAGVKAVTDYLAVGLSDVKVYGLFLSFVIFFAARLFPVSWRRIHVSRLFLTILAVVLLSVSAVVHVIFSLRYGFDFWQAVVGFNQGVFSVTYFSHNHLLKPALSMMAGFFGVRQTIGGWDGAAGLGGLFPTWLYLSAAVATGVLVVGLLLYWLDREPAVSAQWRLCLRAWYVVGSFIVVTTIFDGGLFNMSTLIVLPFWLTAVWWNNSARRAFVFLSSGVVISFFLAVIIAGSEAHGFRMSQIIFVAKKFLPTVALCLLPLVFYFIGIGRRLWVGLVVIMVIAVMVLSLGQQTTNRWRYLTYVVQPNTEVFFSTTSAYPGLPLAARVEPFYVYRLTTDTLITVSSLLRRYNLHPDYFPIGVTGLNCAADIPRRWGFTLVATAIDDQKINQNDDAASPVVIRQWEKREQQYRGYPTYTVVVDINSCVGQQDAILFAWLYQRGIISGFMIPAAPQ